MQLINLTPHTIVLRSPDGFYTELLPSGIVARVTTTPGKEIHYQQGVLPCPVFEAPTFGEVEGIPSSGLEGHMGGHVGYIVSGVVAAALAGKGRLDVFSPGTGPNDGAIRENGQVVAVTRLIACPR